MSIIWYKGTVKGYSSNLNNAKQNYGADTVIQTAWLIFTVVLQNFANGNLQQKNKY